MCESQSKSLFGDDLVDSELVHATEPLPGGMPIFSEFIRVEAIYETILSSIIQPIGIVEDTPELEGRFFWCKLCSQAFEYEERK